MAKKILRKMNDFFTKVVCKIQKNDIGIARKLTKLMQTCEILLLLLLLM